MSAILLVDTGLAVRVATGKKEDLVQVAVLNCRYVWRFRVVDVQFPFDKHGTNGRSDCPFIFTGLQAAVPS
ncbi:hypothetical protein [Citreimonas salinaria]|uniref:hypothetical protein n=1 Tax=Citreimonas salinaria TaxID=321339 RepID=UPI00115FA063|nr:hypothetical protein [Citreimonas salinaria]